MAIMRYNGNSIYGNYVEIQHSATHDRGETQFTGGTGTLTCYTFIKTGGKRMENRLYAYKTKV